MSNAADRRASTLERLYDTLSADERRIVDGWERFPKEDRQAYWTTISSSARRFVYMTTDGNPDI